MAKKKKSAGGALKRKLAELASVDLFARDKSGEWVTGVFVGRPFALNYSRANVLVADAWKKKAGGVPQGTFLLAYYENEEDVVEGLLLRVLHPTSLPTDSDVIASMVEHYKDNLRTGEGKESNLDTFTRYEFSFSGIECRILGTFYQDEEGTEQFGADVENFYSAHNYAVVKPNQAVLEKIVNFREGDIVGRPTDIAIGNVRYSSSTRFARSEPNVRVYVSPVDYLGKRTALFGMTRTGKSNTVKKIIQATMGMSKSAKGTLDSGGSNRPEDNLLPLDSDGVPQFPVGQMVFDVNGEYANANLQDAGTAIFDLYESDTTRYSVIEKPGFKVLKVNFYSDVMSGFDLIRSHLQDQTGDYVGAFLGIDLTPPDQNDHSAKTRADRVRAAYLCCLYKAQFTVPKSYKVKFQGNSDVNGFSGLDPASGLSLDDATAWFEAVWENQHDKYFPEYKRKKNGRDWFGDDLRAVLWFLTRKKTGTGSTNVSGFTKLIPIKSQHTSAAKTSFESDIVKLLRGGKIVIIDLSQGDPDLQNMFSERLCRAIFKNGMERFIANRPNNFVQFYFEEAHNLFPKKEDKDLSQIYNRLAKEGAKLNLGMIYATQEVSSISSNILKNTQNWFIAHLNNEDEVKELRKYYDFADFTEGLIRFSASTDKGFVRMKSYSNPFIVPVQIDRFSASEG